MGVYRGASPILSLIFLAGAILLMFFVVLSGVTDTTPLNKTYFLSADTSSAGPGRAISRWTYFYICGDGNTNCGAPVPALPVGSAWIGGSQGIPSALIGSHGAGGASTYYYYMWRFGWVFYLIGLVVTVTAFFMAMCAPCSRLFSGVTGAVSLFSWFFFTLAASLMTVTFVKMRNAFTSQGLSASIGRYAFGFTWAAWACLTIATVLLFLGTRAKKNNNHGDDHVQVREPRASRPMTSNVGFFRRQRSTRSARGSFVDNESQRRVVKDEYA